MNFRQDRRNTTETGYRMGVVSIRIAKLQRYLKVNQIFSDSRSSRCIG